ncbi:hypothetical protein BDQ12DRAFT_636532 [Crucibulum laeve]|uniref:Uncharacterized protein n=1 Tax=Crucibulum laeve TaxID=68775 RepID=A0A5C3LNS1_9AGAR|nr:hypothetical protein BDQ12DRAFT_636532 [Crucibulum laeve]
MAHFTGEAGAALVFLIGYSLIFGWMVYCYVTHRFKWRSRYSLLFFHVTIRVASQGCGIAFGILGFSNTDVFLAYLILGAEGYFTLVLCAFRFLISWHQHNLPSHESWLEPRMKDTSAKARWRKALTLLVLGPLAVFFYLREPMTIVHCLLILANVAIIFGGSYLAGADFTDVNSQDTRNRLNIAKITRTAGQSVFLACNFMLLVVILVTIRNERRRNRNRKSSKTHSTLILLLVAWFPLIVRGIFGVLQSAVWSLSYYNPENYDSTGFTARFTAIEYVLGVFTEWLACLLLNATFFTSRNDPSKGEIAAEEMKRSNREPGRDQIPV